MATYNNPFKKVADKVTGKEAEEKAHSERLDRYWNSAEGARKEVDWKWFNYDLWVSGNHYAKWDKNTQQITSPSRIDGRPKIVINKVYTTLRSVRSYALQNKPKPNVTPYNLTPETVDQAQKLNKYLEYLHDHLHLAGALRSTFWHALKYSTGFWQVLWNEEEQEIEVNVIDPYDLYWDPTARSVNEARYCVLAVRRNLEDLKEDPKYKDADWDGVDGDRQLSASSLKSRLLKYERGETYSNADKKDATVIVKEFWYKEGGKVMLCTKVGSKIIRKSFDTGLNRIPFFRLASDIEPLSMYGQGWVKNLIPLNRLLERLESSGAEYNELVNKGKYVSDKNAGVKIINNEHGQIIEKKRGFEVTGLNIPRIDGAFLFNQITNANRYIEDIGAMHDASLGRIPSGAQSGVAIELLMEGDSNNLSELIANTSEFLEEVYEYILFLASEKYQFIRNVTTTSNTGEFEFMSFIGEGADPSLASGATVIPSKNTVDVKIESWLAHTGEGRRMAVEQLSNVMNANGYQLPPDFILEAFQTGNIADIVSKMMQQQQAQAEAQQQQAIAQEQAKVEGQMAQNAQQAQIQAETEARNAPKPAGAKQAIALIKLVLNGQMPEVPPLVDGEFIAYLDQFIQSPEAQSVGGEILSVLQQIRDQAVLNMQPGSQGQPGGAGTQSA